MSYGVALRNGVPFTLGTIAALCVNATSQAFSPLVLWPDGIATPGMWISPRDLTSQWADYLGTTPVATPGTVADSANPVGLALDIRAGAPEVLGPELVVNGDLSDGTNDWGQFAGDGGTLSVVSGALRYTANGTVGSSGVTQLVTGLTVGKTYQYTLSLLALADAGMYVYFNPGAGFPGAGGFQALGAYAFTFVATSVSFSLVVRFAGPLETAGDYFEIDNISVREVPGNHMLQSTSAARPLLSAYDGQTLGPGDTYDATGYPIFQLYDGVDDGMATAAFAAGTLTSGMDCMIAVRRDSDTPPHGVVGLQNQIQNVCLGMYTVGVGDPCCFGCGSPTVWVNEVQLPSATKGELYTALPVGEWRIVEFRGLDLSAWTALTSGMWGGGVAFNGARGDILLYPSTASTTDKDAARQWLADYYGVTLP